MSIFLAMMAHALLRNFFVMASGIVWMVRMKQIALLSAAAMKWKTVGMSVHMNIIVAVPGLLPVPKWRLHSSWQIM